MSALAVRRWGVQNYDDCWRRMRRFTERRDERSVDRLWLLEHPSLFTLGGAGRLEHVRDAGDIPVWRTDRGGQVSWHGPGQLVGYLLLDLRRRRLGVRALVRGVEDALIEALRRWDLPAETRPRAPGVYVDGRKIAALGLRVHRGCSYHGFSFNVDCDLRAFERIDPCGQPGLRAVSLRDLMGASTPPRAAVERVVVESLAARFDYAEIQWSADASRAPA